MTLLTPREHQALRDLAPTREVYAQSTSRCRDATVSEREIAYSSRAEIAPRTPSISRSETEAARYRTIVADPPWDHSDGTGVTLTVGMSNRKHPNAGVRGVPYNIASLAEIRALPVTELAAQDAHLYLWVTNRYLRHAWDVAEAWDFRGVCILTWCKEPRGFLGGGAFPSNTEFCLFARRGSLPTSSRAEGRWFRWPRQFGPPVREGETRNTRHSAKPEAFLDLVEQVSPGPYLELFARRQRLGWDTYGDEALNHVDLKVASDG